MIFKQWKHGTATCRSVVVAHILIEIKYDKIARHCQPLINEETYMFRNQPSIYGQCHGIRNICIYAG